ncbi:MAG: hypothetical protein Q8R69_18760 [Telluria sp.]|nr:hypothetical protein [Telluria sp.]
MKKSLIFLCLFLFAHFAPYARAQIPGTTILLPNNVVGPYSTYFPPGQTGFVPSTGYSSGTSSGVTVNVSGVANVSRGGVVTKIPVSIASAIPKSAVATAAVGAWSVAKRLAGPVGMGIAAYDIYKEIEKSDLVICPAPDFFCTPETTGDMDTYPNWSAAGISSLFPSAETAGAARAAKICTENGAAPGTPNCPALTGACVLGSLAYSSVDAVCPASGSYSQIVVNAVKVVVQTTTPGHGAADPDIENASNGAQNSDSSGESSKKYWDAADNISNADQASGGPGISPDVMHPPSSTTNATAPPVSTPTTTKSTETFTDSNGVPQTRTTTESTTTTPTLTGNGSQTTITYNTNTTTTTSVTNNTSTSTSNPPTVEVKNDYQPTPVPASQQIPQMELPNDYNKEVTQQKVLDEITGASAPDAPADQEERTATKVAETDLALDTAFKDIVLKFVPDKENWFSWVWTPPIATCNDADFAGTVHGYSVAFSICPWVAKIREALGFLFALFGAMMIYGQIFKKEE